MPPAKALLLRRVVQATWAFTGLYVVNDVAVKVLAVPHAERLRVGFDWLLFHGVATWYVPGLIVRNTMLFASTAGHAVADLPAQPLSRPVNSLLRTWLPAGTAMTAITLLAPHVATYTHVAFDHTVRPALDFTFGSSVATK